MVTFIHPDDMDLKEGGWEVVVRERFPQLWVPDDNAGGTVGIERETELV